MLSQFIVGENYTNDQIYLTLKVRNVGGVRPSINENKQLNHLAILTSASSAKKPTHENPYHDRIENDILIYTAQGKVGDQTIGSENKRLLEQYTSPVPFYCFSNEGEKGYYRFLGLLELLRHYQDTQLDSKKFLRKVWVFEFRILSSVRTIPIDKASEISKMLLGESKALAPSFPEEREVVIESPEVLTPDLQAIENEDLRMQLLQINPYRFEHLVKDVILANGFRDATVTPASQDGGIDLSAYVASNNEFFSNTHVQFQIKRWRHSVGSVEINGFRGALSTTAKGVFVTTSHFTKAAINEANHPVKPAISLIDGIRFATIVRRANLDLTRY